MKAITRVIPIIVKLATIPSYRRTKDTHMGKPSSLLMIFQ